MPLTPYMGLLLPDPTVTPGPTYATEEVTAFTTIDSHNHTLGNGAPIPSDALDINNDLPFNDYNATEFRATRFTSQSAALSLPTDVTELYVVNGNLFYNNNLGQPVQITNGAAIDATSIGGIGGDYATSTASVFYTSADGEFTFWSNTNITASIICGPISFSNDTLSAPSITFAPNSGITSDYQLTWPAALPVATEGMTVDPSGNVSFSGGTVPSGAVVMYGGITPPAGWLFCDGTAYLIATYPALAASLFDSGTGNYSYGSPDAGATQFNVPDFRGIFPRGTLNGGPGANDPDASTRGAAAANGNTGNNVGSNQANQVQQHLHNIAIYTSQSLAPPATLVGTGQLTDPTGTGSTGGIISGGGSGNQTNPVNIYINFIIKI